MTAFIFSFAFAAGFVLNWLMSMGILPGMPLRMIQTFPSYVFEVGYTQVAVDKKIASTVKVNL